MQRKSVINILKAALKSDIKTAEATAGLVGNKIAEKITKIASKTTHETSTKSTYIWVKHQFGYQEQQKVSTER